MSTRFNYIPNRVIDTDGISDGASVHFYLPDTTTPVDLFLDAEATTPAPNPYPVPAGAAVPPLYYTEEAVRVRIETTSGDVPFDESPYVPIGASSGGGSDIIASTEFLYVHNFREEGDVYDTDAFLRCEEEAVATGKGVAFAKGEGSAVADDEFTNWEPGDYIIGINGANNNPDSVGNLRSNVVIYVPAGVTVWQAPATSYMFYYNPVGVGTVAGSPHIVLSTAEEALHDVVFRIDGQLNGNVEVEGFAENVTTIALSASRNILIEGNGSFNGTRSDAIGTLSGDIGPHAPGTVNTAKQVRHNSGITIRGLTFDGINKNNRNAISIINGRNILIEKCKFKNFSRPGGGGNATDPFDINTGNEAPGAIDLEPNYFSFPNISCANVLVRDCTFENIGTSGVCFNLPHNKYDDGGTIRTNNTVIENFYVQNCTFDTLLKPLNAILGGNPGGNDANGAGYNIVFEKNISSNCNRAWEYLAGRGVTIRNNLFRDMTVAAYVGYYAAYGVRDFKIVGNRFERCGNSVLGAFQIIGYGGEDFLIEGNEFLDCAGSAWSWSGLTTLPWRRGKIRNNKILPATPGATKTMGSAIYYGEYNGVALFDNATIVEEGNDWNSLLHFSLVFNGGRSAAIPAGTWKRGNEVFYPEAPPGEPEKFICIYDTTGAANPAAWAESLRGGGLADIDWTPSGTITKSAGMSQSADWRFTNTAGGVQYAYVDTTLAASPGAEIIVRAPRSGHDSVLVGFSDAATPTTVNDVDYGVSFNGGKINGVVNGALNGPDTSLNISYEWMQEFRIRLAGGVVTIWKKDPLTGAETQVYTGGGFINATTRLAVVIGGQNQSVQVTKFGAP